MERRRDLRPAHPEHADGGPGAGRRSRQPDEGDRHPPRREAARGDDLHRRGPRTVAFDDRYVISPTPVLGHGPRAGRRAGARGLRLPSDTNDRWLTADDSRAGESSRRGRERSPTGARRSTTTTSPPSPTCCRRLADHRPRGGRASRQTSAERTGAREAVAVTSGTAALHVAYAALGIGPGDEVVVPPLTFVATAATAVAARRHRVFADVDPDTGNLDPPRPRAGSPTAPGSSPRSTTPASRPNSTQLRKVADGGRTAVRGRRPLPRWHVARPPRRLARRPDHVLVLPHQEPHHRRGRRGGQPVGRAGGTRPGRSATRARARPRPGSATPTRAAGTRRCTSSA